MRYAISVPFLMSPIPVRQLRIGPTVVLVVPGNILGCSCFGHNNYDFQCTQCQGTGNATGIGNRGSWINRSAI